jgi:murein DD-endopeptidase MepM/ murein hydrolase activator NlpD
MNLIIVSKQHGQTKTLSSWWVVVFMVLCVGLMTAAGYAGYSWRQHIDKPVFDGQAADAWRATLLAQKEEVGGVRDATLEQLQALTVRIGVLQARLTRVDALGERLIAAANLEDGEFDFSVQPALGGPGSEAPLDDRFVAPDFMATVEALSERIESREQQLELLERLLASESLQGETYIAGRPILRGWMSSRYGYRTDPFNGSRAWHDGVDFAGKDGSDIIAVAAGVVTFADVKSGYGLMLDINHGNGYVTRYGHTKTLEVAVGEVIKKGQTIAKMGSSGRSTGPHVHFEVLLDGRPQDPSKFINRTALR